MSDVKTTNATHSKSHLFQQSRMLGVRGVNRRWSKKALHQAIIHWAQTHE